MPMRWQQGWRAASCAAVTVLLVALGLVAPPLFPLAAQAALPSPALKARQQAAAELYRAGRWAEALAASEGVLAETRKEFGPDHEQVAIQDYGLGLVAEAAGRLDVAERAWRDNVRIGEIVYGRDSAAATQGMERLADVLVRMGRPGEGEPLLRRVLAIRSAIVGPENSYNASAHAGLGAAALARGNASEALASFRTAVRLLTGRPETQTLASHVMQAEVRRQAGVFSGLVAAAWQVAARDPAAALALRDESYAAGQRAWITAAAGALARMSARIAAGDTPLGRRIRRQQDAAERIVALHQEDMRTLAAWSEVQRRDITYSSLLERFRAASIASSRDNAPAVKRQTELVRQLQDLLARCPPGQSKPGCEASERERTAIARELGELSQVTQKTAGPLMALNREMTAAEARLPGYQGFQATRKANIETSTRLEQTVAAERLAIAAAAPEYRDLIDPAPLSLAATAALLGPDEALVTVLVGPERSFVWAVSREASAWAPIAAGERALAAEVATLRQALDPLAPQPPGTPPGALAPFDLARAHALYRLVLGPVEAGFRNKRQLLLVPTGPLTSLPFHVLLTDAPPPGLAAPDAQRRAAYLARRHAISVLPSVPSLAALRRTGQKLEAAEPYLGIGDPALNGPPVPAGKARGAPPALASLYRNGHADLRALRELEPLPETALELTAIAAALHAPPGALLLRNEATETRVRHAALERYRIIHFATHGLVAGDLSGLDEPALVLTPPPQATADDDGLLTASEVAALSLRADWVVLSACNTASGAEVGADALSGLARAFFYAGARALLVSHWAVDSDAAVALTTGTFAALAHEPGLGRAEAFRRTMLAMIDRGLPPTAWAPFVIVGEGR